MLPGSLRDRWRSVLRQRAHDREADAGTADAEPVAEAGIGEEPPSPEKPPPPPPVPDRPEITEEMVTEHWLLHVRKLIDAGVPLQRVARSLRNASIQVDDDWFKWAMDEARERIAALGPGNTSTDLQEQSGSEGRA
jgi:hypothetical protein